jgi:hypothetical protein
MALELKCTKIQANRTGDDIDNPWVVTAYFELVAGGPSVPSSVTLTAANNTVTSPSELQDAIDDAVELVGSNTVDWSK